jgi:hypothetical protein
LINANSMAVIFKSKITFSLGAIFCFGTILYVANVEETLHRTMALPKKKPSSGIPQEARVKPRAMPPLTAQQGMAPRKSELKSPRRMEGQSTRDSPTWRTPLSTSPTKVWTRITQRREVNAPYWGRKTRQAILPTPLPSKKDEKKRTAVPAPLYPDVLFIQGRLESSPIFDDEPTMQGEEPPQRDARRRRNRRRNVRRHHKAEEWDPAQPVSRDEASEMGETPNERAHRERHNSRRCDCRQAQERERGLAEQDARLRWENPLLARNLYPNFARALNTSSEVGGVLAQIADGLPRTPDAEGYRWLLTQATNHLLTLTEPTCNGSRPPPLYR